MLTQAQQLKDSGNEEFLKGNYKEAISFYDKAINEDNTQSIFYSNRSKCYLKLNDYQKTYSDALTAVELDDKNIKAHLALGQAVCYMAKQSCDSSRIDQAIQRLTKARTLCAGQQKQDFEKQIDEKIYNARKLQWFIKQEEELQKNKQVIKQLESILKADTELTAEQKAITQSQIDKYIRLEEGNLKIPDYLLCKVITTQFGYSYERKELNKLSQQIDPFTKQAMNPSLIFSNINLKQACQEFLQRNPWAYDYQPGQSYSELEF